MLPSTKPSSESSASTVTPMANPEKGALPAPEDPLNDSPGSLATLDTADLDVRAERRLLRKIDFHVYPILFVIYMLSFLDRINISNARIQGLDVDLDLSGNRFNIALFVSRPLSSWTLAAPWLCAVLMGISGLFYPLCSPRGPQQHGDLQGPAIMVSFGAHILLGPRQHVHGFRTHL